MNFEAILPITPCPVRGLARLRHHFRLKAPRIPERLLHTVLADARRPRRPDGGLNELLYQFRHSLYEAGETAQTAAEEALANADFPFDDLDYLA